ncbi:MAG TPA: HAMP domain-containing sensor histidine kinase [Bacteroidales bacterium]|nr:HAMP domain-containing sensor histidine kinase [Bacteroidales bacterium]
MQLNKQAKTKDNFRVITVLVILLVLVFGIYQIRRVIQANKDQYAEVKQIALTAAAMMHYNDLINLNAVSEDTLKIEYAVIKKMLADITSVNSSAVYSYVFTKRNGKMYVMADSEPNESPNYASAGEELKGVTIMDHQLMDNGSIPMVVYSKNRWGDWVSVLIPLQHPITHQNFAVFGMDFNAKVWKSKRNKDLFLIVLVILLSMMVVIAIFRIISNSQKLKKDFMLLKKAEADLLISKEKAEESDRLKTSFLKNISHEIRTPMNSILGFAGLLKEQNLSAQYKQLYLQNMINSGQRMLNTINDIIDLSRVQSGQISATIVRTNMAEQLYRLQDRFSGIASEKGLEYRCNIAQDDMNLNFYTDSELLHTILEKLTWNAFKFTPKGFVEIGYRSTGSHLEFYVKDSGVGVNDVQKSFIFEYFRQGNDSMTRDHEGNGLGLTIAKAYVELLGGEIWVESNEGEGSIFKFTVPFCLHEHDFQNG